MFKLIMLLLTGLVALVFQMVSGYNPISAYPVESIILGCCLLTTNYKTIKLPAIPFAVGQSKTLSLPIGKLYSRLHLWIKGTLNVTTAVDSVHEDACARFLHDIAIVGSSPNVISDLKKFPGHLKYMKNKTQDGIAPINVKPGVGILNHPFTCLITINFITLMSVNRLVSLLDSRLFDSLDLQVLFGSKTDLVVEGAGVATEPVGFVYPVLEIIEPPAAILKNPILIERYISKEVTQADSDFSISLTKGALYKSLFLCHTNASIRSNALAKDVRLALNNTEVKKKYNWDELQAENNTDYRIAMDTGVGLIEVDPDGDMRGLINSASLSDLRLLFDMSTPTSVAKTEVITDEIIRTP